MINAGFFWQSLIKEGFSFFSGVPCSILKPVLSDLPPGIKYIPAVREDSALGVASGSFIAGRKSAILIQNSGLGNIVNALTSFNLIYKVPVLLIITWRGEPGKPDAPEHTIMGELTLPILETLKIPYKIIDDSFDAQVEWAKKEMEGSKIPVALVLKEGIIK